VIKLAVCWKSWLNLSVFFEFLRSKLFMEILWKLFKYIFQNNLWIDKKIYIYTCVYVYFTYSLMWIFCTWEFVKYIRNEKYRFYPVKNWLNSKIMTQFLLRYLWLGTKLSQIKPYFFFSFGDVIWPSHVLFSLFNFSIDFFQTIVFFFFFGNIFFFFWSYIIKVIKNFPQK
jgi:hypothetical protein